MSRGIRDLRDLICVSRLTIRHSDEEFFSSDDDSSTGRLSELTRNFSKTSLSSQTTRDGSASNQRGQLHSPDSGIGTSNQSPQESQENVEQSASSNTTPRIVPRPPTKVDDSVPRAYRKKKKKKPRKLKLDPSVPGDIPKAAPLPPVTQWTHKRPSSSSSVESEKGSKYMGARNKSGHRAQESKTRQVLPTLPSKEGNFDEMLTFIDAALLSEWLQKSNRNVTELATFCHAGENFVQFAHFWLSEFPDFQKHEIFKLETSIIIDNMNFAFALGREAGVVKQRDIQKFMDAVFREYPNKLLSVKGPHLFLDYLDVLSSERQDAYKKVLSDVKCSTRVKSHAQWTLGIRSYTLVSIWTSVVQFYRKFQREARSRVHIAEPVHISAVNKNDPQEIRMYQAIRNGYTDVVNYLLRSGHIKPTMTDLDNKGLLFTAVMHNQPKVLSFLLKHIRPRLNVNLAANTGNTPLHAAANNGNVELAAILLAESDIIVNVTNPQCDDATPLHLAVMHGHAGVVELLLKVGADMTLKMGGLTALDIARDFEHFTIYNLLDNNREPSANG